MEKSTKLSKKTIMGYSFGAMADAASYNFYIMYALYFLTTIAGLGAGKAGLVISIATVVSACSALIIGPLSDNTKGRFGRRIPYIFIGGILMMVGLTLFFRPVGFSDGGKFIYYLAMFIIIGFSYGIFLVPYNALGAELTDDYDERTKLRTPATVLNCVGNIVGVSLPLTVVAMLVGMGKSEGSAWTCFAFAVGVVCFIALLITVVTTKGKELPIVSAEENGGKKKENPLKVFWQILNLKPFRYIIVILLLFGIGYMVFMSGLVYYVLFCAGLTEAQMSTAMFIFVFICMGWTIVVSVIATKLTKKTGMALCFLAAALGIVIMYFTGVHSFTALIMLLVIFGLGNCSYWLLIYPMIYDIAEVYEYKFGQRSEGALMATYGFIFTISTALGTQVLTRAMEAIGYDPALTVQSETTIDGIANIVLGIPFIVFVLAAVCCIVYPLTKEKFEKLMNELEKKRAGEKTDETGLERII